MVWKKHTRRRTGCSHSGEAAAARRVTPGEQQMLISPRFDVAAGVASARRTVADLLQIVVQVFDIVKELNKSGARCCSSSRTPGWRCVAHPAARNWPRIIHRQGRRAAPRPAIRAVFGRQAQRRPMSQASGTPDPAAAATSLASCWPSWRSEPSGNNSVRRRSSDAGKDEPANGPGRDEDYPPDHRSLRVPLANPR